MNLVAAFPLAEHVLAATDEQIAYAMLFGLVQDRRTDIRQRFARDQQGQAINFHLQSVSYSGYGTAEYEVGLAVGEAWTWLERELLLIPAPGINGGSGWRVLSRRGQTFLDAGNAGAIRASKQIDRESLHPSLRGDALDNFWRGSYDVAVFCAYRTVEVAVRTAGAFPQTRIGTQLMRDAFNPAGGPLRDTVLPPAEQEAMMMLFSGAIGLFKNPNSHRYVHVTPESAAALLVLASHLLQLVDARVQVGGSQPSGAPAAAGTAP